MAEKTAKKTDDMDALYILLYLGAPISSIILYFTTKENQKLKFHVMQSLILGIIAWILDFTLILSIFGFLLLIYGIYVGYKEYTGETVKIPVIGDYAGKPS